MSIDMGAGSGATNCKATITSIDLKNATLMAWVKGADADWSAGSNIVWSSDVDNSTADAMRLAKGTADDSVRCYGPNTDSSLNATSIQHDVWVPCFATISTPVSTPTHTAILKNSSTAKSSRAQTNTPPSAAVVLRIGTTGSGFTACALLIAEVALWDAPLTDAEMDSVWTSTDTGIDARDVDTSTSGANLQGYWKLNVDTTAHTNYGSDSGTLAMVGTATYNSDNPTITYSGDGANETVYPFTGPWR